MQKRDLADRLLNFSVGVIKVLRVLPYDPEYKVIRYQLTKSSTSAGANYEEAQAATTKPDFHNKVKISLREMRESNYWLRVLSGVIDAENTKNELINLIEESVELKNILGTIAFKTKKQ